jgi:hypothetical protein
MRDYHLLPAVAGDLWCVPVTTNRHGTLPARRSNDAEQRGTYDDAAPCRAVRGRPRLECATWQAR